jgi:hypothetical protein
VMKTSASHRSVSNSVWVGKSKRSRFLCRHYSHWLDSERWPFGRGKRGESPAFTVIDLQTGEARPAYASCSGPGLITHASLGKYLRPLRSVIRFVSVLEDGCLSFRLDTMLNFQAGHLWTVLYLPWTPILVGAFAADEQALTLLLRQFRHDPLRARSRSVSVPFALCNKHTVAHTIGEKSEQLALQWAHPIFLQHCFDFLSQRPIELRATGSCAKD